MQPKLNNSNSTQPTHTNTFKRMMEAVKIVGKRFVALFVSGAQATVSVVQATRKQQEIQSKVNEIKTQIANDQTCFEHRRAIEDNYDNLVTDYLNKQEREKTAASLLAKEIEQKSAKVKLQETSLNTLIAKHEEELRPYKELMDSSKGRNDDSARALADAKRDVKAADQALAAAVKRRDQQISNAHHNVDSARERLTRVEAGLSRLQQDPNSTAAAISKMQGEVITERAHLDVAIKDVDRISNEEQQSVNAAQDRYNLQKQACERANTHSMNAQAEARGHREEYEALYKDKKSEETQLKDALDAVKKDLQQKQQSHKETHDRLADIQAALDEAHSIHATPEMTRTLYTKIQQETKLLNEYQQTHERLSQHARDLRKRTRLQRVVFVALVLVIIVLVGIALYALVQR